MTTLSVYNINQFVNINCTFDEANRDRLRRLRYVTENFQYLKGLTTVAFGVSLLAGSIADLFEQSWLIQLSLWTVQGASVVGMFRLPKYYQRRFGEVEHRPMTRNESIALAGIFFVGIPVLLVGVLFSRPLGRFVEYICAGISYRLHPMLADPNHLVNFMPILFWLLLLVLSISFRRNQRIDLRRTSMLFGGTLIWTVVMILPLHYPHLENVTWWKVLNAGWFGVSMILIGVYEHLTLVFLLPRASEVEQ